LRTTTSIIAAGLFLTTLFSTFGLGLKGSDSANSEIDTEQTLIDFSNASVVGWRIVNDSVMGGMSRSTLQEHEDGYAQFRGTVSLENNGGFASVRARTQRPIDLSDFKGISVRVRGDGKIYSLRLRTVKNGRLTRYSYEARFATNSGEWETYKLAYSDFSPVFRGNPVRGNPDLNSDAILEIGFMIQDGQEGPFRLDVQKLSVYRPESE